MCQAEPLHLLRLRCELSTLGLKTLDHCAFFDLKVAEEALCWTFEGFLLSAIGRKSEKEI
jgi:hypothetical protein